MTDTVPATPPAGPSGAPASGTPPEDLPANKDEAQSRSQRLAAALPAASGVRAANGARFVIAGMALHSETLAPWAVLIAPRTGSWYCAAPETLAPTAGAEHPDSVLNMLDLLAVTHRKGGLYTRLTAVAVLPPAHGAPPAEELVLYAAHTDATWWLRPRAMFEDGRFTPSPEAPLGPEELGLIALA